MKKNVFSAVILCLALLCGCSLLFGPRISGRWEGTASFELNPDGPEPHEIVLVISESGDTITGTLQWFTLYDLSHTTDVTGACAGRHVKISGLVHGLALTLEGEVDDGTMAGTCTFHGKTDTWEVTRVD